MIRTKKIRIKCEQNPKKMGTTYRSQQVFRCTTYNLQWVHFILNVQSCLSPSSSSIITFLSLDSIVYRQSSRQSSAANIAHQHAHLFDHVKSPMQYTKQMQQHLHPKLKSTKNNFSWQARFVWTLCQVGMPKRFVIEDRLVALSYPKKYIHYSPLSENLVGWLANTLNRRGNIFERFPMIPVFQAFQSGWSSSGRWNRTSSKAKSAGFREGCVEATPKVSSANSTASSVLVLIFLKFFNDWIPILHPGGKSSINVELTFCAHSDWLPNATKERPQPKQAASRGNRTNGIHDQWWSSMCASIQFQQL